MTKQATQVTAKPSEYEYKEELSKMTTVSSMIRFLTAKKMERGAIAKLLSIHLGRKVIYQHVRNVQITPIKKQK